MNKVSEHLNATLPGLVLESHIDTKSGFEVIHVPSEKIVDIITLIKTELMFDMLTDLFGVDWDKSKSQRFEVSYLFYNTTDNTRVQICTLLPDNDKPEINSIHKLYANANWSERECWDMYGIKFTNHPHLHRLLTWEGFKGYPLRKDFKINQRQPIPVLQKLL